MSVINGIGEQIHENLAQLILVTFHEEFVRHLGAEADLFLLRHLTERPQHGIKEFD
ncbi:hypothetical protein D3C74_463150 [compost metagenome]